ncbi:TM2 domain-containing protein [Mycobacterium sp. 663a-19]|uniref:TM2 domain-containing protein n=1 Tax=Mycobacterium sp. 663a-19 TaxID=2986148 RepID=UPI002D79989D|nr:TM2 domain-containing protein [Mycobacterium sp. 663a-19]
MATPNPPENEPPRGWQPPGYGPHQHPQFPPPPGYPPPYPGYPSYPGYPGNVVDPQAPFGRDPVTGVPLSDKSSTTAGLLQLFLGVFGIGRFYIDSTQIAIAQLCLGLFGFVFTLFCWLGLPILLGSVIWAIVDAIMMFTGGVTDNYGRKLR